MLPERLLRRSSLLASAPLAWGGSFAPEAGEKCWMGLQGPCFAPSTRGIKAERRQLEDNRKYWERRLQTIDDDLAREPGCIRRTFERQTHRVEPAGAIDLWPQEVA